MTAADLKQRLNERAEEFAQYLLPAGRKDGNEWLVGSLAGEIGKSLSIRIGDSKVGVWSDFATGESGSNLLELYIQKRQVNCATAIKWAQLFEGKNVALVLDADAAGRAATERITRLLAPLVASLKHYAWEARDVA